MFACFCLFSVFVSFNIVYLLFFFAGDGDNEYDDEDDEDDVDEVQ